MRTYNTLQTLNAFVSNGQELTDYRLTYGTYKNTWRIFLTSPQFNISWGSFTSPRALAEALTENADAVANWIMYGTRTVK